MGHTPNDPGLPAKDHRVSNLGLPTPLPKIPTNLHQMKELCALAHLQNPPTIHHQMAPHQCQGPLAESFQMVHSQL